MASIKVLSNEEMKAIALSESEMAELEIARNMPISFDEDCVETTPERALKFQRVNPHRKGGVLA